MEGQSLNAMKILSIITLLILSIPAFSCDFNKASSGSPNPIVITLQPGVPHVETWDFSDCGFGITSDSFSVMKPRTKSGALNTLPPGTPLTVTIHDLTDDTYYTDSFVYFGINNYASVCGHIVEITLTLSTSAHKNLDIEITQSANWGGPCQ